MPHRTVEPVRATVVKTALGIGAIACFGAAWLNEPGRIETWRNSILLPAIGAFALLLLLAVLHRPARAPVAAQMAVGVYMAYLLSEIAFNLFGRSEPLGDTLKYLFPLTPWSDALIVFAYVLLDRRRALWASVAFAGACAATVAIYLAIHWSSISAIEMNALGQAFFLVPPFLLVLLQVVVRLALALGAADQEAAVLGRLALTDDLTRLANRRASRRALQLALAQRDRGGLGVGVVLLDLDHFKQVNDRHGHEIGDVVLRHVADTLAELMRDSDLAGRWGGEEFLLVCVGASPDLAAVGQRLHRALASRPVPGVGITVTASLGGAVAAPGETMESLLGRADAALYEAKRAGRNRTVIAPPPAAHAMGIIEVGAARVHAQLSSSEEMLDTESAQVATR